MCGMSVTVRFKFMRTGPVRYLGHLDMLRYFQKAVMKAELDAKYTEGFHPHQIMSFAYPLGVGMETYGDYMDLEMNACEDAEALMDRLNAVMHEGIKVTGAVILREKALNAMAAVAEADYELVVAMDGKVSGDSSVDIACEAEKENAETVAADSRQAAGDDRTAADCGAMQEVLTAAINELMARSEITGGKSGKNIRPGIRILECRICKDYKGSNDKGNDDYELRLVMRLSSGSKLNVRPADVFDKLCGTEAVNESGVRFKVTHLYRMEIYGNDKDGRIVALNDKTAE
ncbi:MAG: TIGR03936 family radical SAM-associated protein [Lachnospiraceae bacterium]|nr:TIGR03936 family radical SAM-associated protein [Lachnospiraceae bacterium]